MRDVASKRSDPTPLGTISRIPPRAGRTMQCLQPDSIRWGAVVKSRPHRASTPTAGKSTSTRLTTPTCAPAARDFVNKCTNADAAGGPRANHARNREGASGGAGSFGGCTRRHPSMPAGSAGRTVSQGRRHAHTGEAAGRADACERACSPDVEWSADAMPDGASPERPVARHGARRSTHRCGLQRCDVHPRHASDLVSRHRLTPPTIATDIVGSANHAVARSCHDRDSQAWHCVAAIHDGVERPVRRRDRTCAHAAARRQALPA